MNRAGIPIAEATGSVQGTEDEISTNPFLDSIFSCPICYTANGKKNIT
jgi:hypothetical protein